MRMTTRDAYHLPASIDYANAFVSLPVMRGTLGSVALHVNYSSEDGTEPHPILHYTFATRETKELFALGGSIRSVAFDRSGYHMLYVTADRRLFYYDGATVVRVGKGISGAVW